MAGINSSTNSLVDPQSGYNPETKIFHSLRPSVPLPPLTDHISITQYVLSLLLSSTDISPETTTFLIDANTGYRLLYSNFINQIENLSCALKARFGSSLRKGDVAFIISPPSLTVPVLYFSLLSLGVVISPTNPLSSESEIAYQVQLSKPVIAFATSSTAHKLPKLDLGTILIDSSEFNSLINTNQARKTLDRVLVNQSDSAAILYSSGTTGRVKGVLITHRNIIAAIGGYYHLQSAKEEESPRSVSLFSVPLFHVFGLIMIVRAVSIGDTLVLMEKFDFEKMLKAVERYRVVSIPVAPPMIVLMTKSDLVGKYDLSSLQVLYCGGSPLNKEVAEKFAARFPHVEIGQGYGLTETGGVTRTIGPYEAKQHGSVGRIAENMEAKIVDPTTGETLPPGQRGELWLRGPNIMKGYVGDDKATAETLDSEGWLKTGDLCYFDSEGFLYIVDRLKELIKYKGYQVPPAELELLLQFNPDIADAAVVPYPDDAAGEIPMAYVVRKPASNINEAQVIDYIAKQVAPHKKVRRVTFVNEIPKSPAGKILRRELVNHALSSSSKL